MTLAAGTHVGPYEVAAPIGAGGMGEVYKARDTRLNRTVAIKVLATHLTNRPDLRARFDREAQTLASLSHPHICPVFDVGRHDGADYIVMEYIEGGTLADRLRRGPVPVDEALQIATAIADALDNAHRQGIVHRDLKPGNIMLTKSGAKLLDFGLAKLKQEASLFNTATTSPAGVPITAEGTILGTIQYMAPEQLEGKEADARTDIFAFGAVVHEMITGDKTFEGSSQASLIAAILDRDPPSMSTRQPMTPPLLDRVVRKCLTKNPERRWQSAGDLRDELRWIAEGTQSAEGPRPSRGANYKRLAYSATTAAVLLAGAVVILGIRSPPPSAPPEEVRFDIAAPNIPNPRQLTISPDGRWIAFPASTETRRTALFVRRIDSTSLEQLAGTEGAARPFWAPDSQSIGFFVGGKVKKIGVSGGPVQNICDAPGTQDGGTWNHDGIVIFSSGGILRRVAASGGEPVQIRAPDASRQETLHVFPSFLPDGKHFLYLAWSNQQARRATYVGSLESTDVVKLFDSQSQVIYAPPGFLLFHKNGSLLAQPFDPDKIVLTGSISRIVDEVSYNALSGEAAFAVSNNQRLIYRAGGGPAVSREFVWSDRTGHREGTIGNPGIYTANFDLSPEGTRIAVAQRNGENAQYDIWAIDAARNTSTRLTFDSALSPNGNVVWAPDGSRVAFASERNGNRDIFEKKTGASAETPVLATPDDEWPEDWSKDGRYLAYGSNSSRPSAFADLYVLPLFGARKPIAISQSPFTEDEPRFSPDGKWLAYDSNESGSFQVYIVSVPEFDQKRQISVEGGVQPRWRRDGKELYYLGPDGAMMAVDFRTDPALEWGAPRSLFNTGLNVDPSRDQFAVTPDGQRFLLQLPSKAEASIPITVVMNWTGSLKK